MMARLLSMMEIFWYQATMESLNFFIWRIAIVPVAERNGLMKRRRYRIHKAGPSEVSESPPSTVAIQESQSSSVSQPKASMQAYCEDKVSLMH